MKKLKELSVFFPAYNEQDNIAATVTKAAAILPQVAQKWEILVVNDGSKDETSQIVNQLIKQIKNLRMITHAPNRGYGGALQTGLYESRYDWVAFTDADGQFDFAEISRLIAKQSQTKADLVLGYYLRRQVPAYRLWGTKAWQLMVRLLFGLKVRDIDCGFKLIKRAVIKKIPRLEAERGPFISSELLVKAQQAGFKFAEIGVHHFPRVAGAATGASLKVILSGLKDLFQLRRKLLQ